MFTFPTRGRPGEHSTTGRRQVSPVAPPTVSSVVDDAEEGEQSGVGKVGNQGGMRSY